VLPISAYRIMI